MKRKVSHASGDPAVSLSVPTSAVNCVLCHEIVHDPHRVHCPCARSFCKSCIAKSLRLRDVCPTCNYQLENVSLIPCCREWGAVLDALPRPCPNDTKCRFRMRGYEEATAHARDVCLFRLETCANEGCGQILFHKNRKEHLRLCRLKKCKNFRPPKYGCQEMGTQKEIEQHEAKRAIPEGILKQIEELIKK